MVLLYEIWAARSYELNDVVLAKKHRWNHNGSDSRVTVAAVAIIIGIRT